jgi:hypothetical protein
LILKLYLALFKGIYQDVPAPALFASEQVLLMMMMQVMCCREGWVDRC